jgi:hypothetical protein
LEILKGRDQFRDLCVNVRIILKWISKEVGCEVLTGLTRLRIGCSGRLL